MATDSLDFVSDTQGNAPAGWYPAGDVQRYWDGTKWTEHTAPLVRAESSPDPEASKQAKRNEKQAERDEKQAERDEKQAERHEKQAERDEKQAEKRAELEAEAAKRKSQKEAAKAGGDVRPDIEAAMAKMSYKMGSKREIKRLPEHLWENEHVDLLTGGMYGPGTGLLVLTDRRLLFVKDGVMAKVSEDFPLEKISSVQWQTGMLLGTITIFASGNKAQIGNVQKPDGKAITDAVRARLNGGPRQAGAAAGVTAAAAPPASAPDAHERLRKLADLHRDGILTDEEFAAKKQQIIEEL
jgi:hypothetical protein